MALTELHLKISDVHGSLSQKDSRPQTRQRVEQPGQRYKERSVECRKNLRKARVVPQCMDCGNWFHIVCVDVTSPVRRGSERWKVEM